AEARKQSRDSGRPGDGRPIDGRYDSNGSGGRQQQFYQRDNSKYQRNSGWRNAQSTSIDESGSSRGYGGGGNAVSASSRHGNEPTYRRRQSAIDDDEPTGSDTASRYLNRSRSSALLGRYDTHRDESPDDGPTRLAR